MSRDLRLRRAACFFAGAVLTGVLLLGGPLEFWWVPLLVGLTYTAAALAGGPKGGLWATALPLLTWGAAVVLQQEGLVEAPRSAWEVFGVGCGVLLCAAAVRMGIELELANVGATIALIGAVYSLQGRVEAVGEASTYVALLAIVGGVNLALALRGS